MKYNKIANTLKIAAVAALVLGMAPTTEAQATGCSNAMLRGTFVYTFAGFSANPAMGPGAELGVQTFDGRGGTTATATLSANGNIYKLTIKGTYIVNDDCTGTFTLQVSPFGFTNNVFFVIDNGGNGFQFMEVNPNQGSIGVVTGVGRRQFPVGDVRSN